MKRRYLIAASAALGAFVLSTAPALAAMWSANEEGVASVCFTSDGLTLDAEQAAFESAQMWNLASTDLDVTAGSCGSADHVVLMGPTSLEGNTLGQTAWSSSGDEFVEVDIVYDIDGIESWAGPDSWRMVVCHEMGHALGLDHSNDRDSCMQTGTSQPVTTPGSSDFEMLRSMYGGSAKPQAASASRNAATSDDDADQDTPRVAQGTVAAREPVAGSGTCTCPNCCGTQAPTTAQRTTVAAPSGGVVSAAPGVVVAPWAQAAPSVGPAPTPRATTSTPSVTTRSSDDFVAEVGPLSAARTQTIDADVGPYAKQLAGQWRSMLRSR